MITIFLYKTVDKKFSHKLVSPPDMAMLNISEGLDFTLTAPPDYEQPWYWVEAEWTTNPAN
jgi:hypothetical protein